MSGTQALHREFKPRGADVNPPEDRPGGMNAFYVSNPHGNLLKFSEPV